MPVITAAEMVQYVTNAKNDGWGYVYSGQGELYSKELAVQWGNEGRAGKSYDYYVNRCARWFGKTVVDCSGLIIQAFRSEDPSYEDKTANNLYNNSQKSGSIAAIPERPGICVWRNGHIGIYIGNSTVIESGGTSVGVVESLLSIPATGKLWTNWGMMADVDYSVPATSPPTEPVWSGRNLKLTNPYMTGSDVLQLQKALAAKGFALGSIDGVFGPLTRAAVINFQNKAGLVADGIAGRNTFAALGSWKNTYSGSTTAGDSQLSSFTLSRVLRLASPNMQGEDVSNVQDALTIKGFSPGKSDGIFGTLTASAVLRFQQANKLTADGIVGKKTTAMLGGLWKEN